MFALVAKVPVIWKMEALNRVFFNRAFIRSYNSRANNLSK